MPQGAATRILGYLRSLSAKEKLAGVADGDLLAQFVAGRDETAFATIVRRHGGMVQQVCRSLLGNHADADDAFQATFLVLAHKGRSIRKSGSLSSWLYGVAYRTALKAKAARATRRRYEAEAAREEPADAAAELTWREAQWVLHQELARLPEKYRAPLVLCYLQGKRQNEAERLLGWRPGKLRSMLERARDVLRKRLLRRGLGPGAVLLTAVGLGGAASTAPAGVLAASTVQAALALTATPAAACAIVSPRVALFVEAVLRTMTTSTLKVGFCACVLVLALGLGLGRTVMPAVQADDQNPTIPAIKTLILDPQAAASPRQTKVRVQASRYWEPHPADHAFDGKDGTLWNSGGYAPQWIEADLQAPIRLARLRLIVTQLPKGQTTHEIWVSDQPIGEDRTAARHVHTFRDLTDDQHRLAFDFPKDVVGRYVQVRTTQSPSWVAWVEIELLVHRADREYLCASDGTSESRTPMADIAKLEPYFHPPLRLEQPSRFFKGWDQEMRWKIPAQTGPATSLIRRNDNASQP